MKRLTTFSPRAHGTRFASALCFAVVALAGTQTGCAGDVGTDEDGSTDSAVVADLRCDEVLRPGSSINEALRRVKFDGTICLADGEYNEDTIYAHSRYGDQPNPREINGGVQIVAQHPRKAFVKSVEIAPIGTDKKVTLQGLVVRNGVSINSMKAYAPNPLVTSPAFVRGAITPKTITVAIDGCIVHGFTGYGSRFWGNAIIVSAGDEVFSADYPGNPPDGIAGTVRLSVTNSFLYGYGSKAVNVTSTSLRGGGSVDLGNDTIIFLPNNSYSSTDRATLVSLEQLDNAAARFGVRVHDSILLGGHVSLASSKPSDLVHENNVLFSEADGLPAVSSEIHKDPRLQLGTMNVRQRALDAVPELRSDSPAIGGANPSTATKSDFYGKSRTANKPDIGAVEYQY